MRIIFLEQSSPITTHSNLFPLPMVVVSTNVLNNMAKIRKQGKIKTSSFQEWKAQSFVYFNLKDTFVIVKV